MASNTLPNRSNMLQKTSGRFYHDACLAQCFTSKRSILAKNSITEQPVETCFRPF